MSGIDTQELNFDEDNYKNHFEKAWEIGLFTEQEPYMYMCEDKDKVYFKHAITRQYAELIKDKVEE